RRHSFGEEVMDHARRAVRRRRVAVLPTLALIFAQPAGAATSDALRAALAYAPPSLAAPDRRTTLEFVNLAEAAALTKKRGADALLAIVGRIGFSAGTRSLGIALHDPGAWREATGFGLEHLDTLLEYGEV